MKYFEQSNVNFRQNLNNFIVLFLQWDFNIITIETRNCLSFSLLLHSLILIMIFFLIFYRIFIQVMPAFITPKKP